VEKGGASGRRGTEPVAQGRMTDSEGSSGVRQDTKGGKGKELGKKKKQKKKKTERGGANWGTYNAYTHVTEERRRGLDERS